MNPVNRHAWTAVSIFLGTSLCTLLSSVLIGANSIEPSLANSTVLEIGRGGEVKLIVVGAEKTQLLRFQPKVGQQQTMSLLWNWQSGFKVADKPVLAMKLPTIVATIDTKVTKVESNGDIHYQMNYREVDVQSSDRQAAAFKRQFQSLVGLKGDYVVSSQGQTKSTNLTLPNQLNDSQKAILQQFSQSLSNLSAPLPEFAVGIGGKWQHTFPMTVNGAKIDQETTYELLSLKDGKATIGVTLNQTAKNQRMVSPVKGVGDFQLESLNSQGQGQMVLKLDRIMPIESTFNMDSKMIAKAPKQTQGKESGAAGTSVETESKIQVKMTSQDSP